MSSKKQQPNAYLSTIPAITRLFDRADYIDQKTITGSVSLREFVAGFVGYQPFFVDWLFRLSNVFIRLLGQTHDTMPHPTRPRPEDVSMQPGERMMFTVIDAQEDLYWIGGEQENHLDFEAAAVVEPLADGTNRLYLITFVRFNKPVGRLYFRTIEPFHHLLVWLSMRAAIKPHQQQTRTA